MSDEPPPSYLDAVRFTPSAPGDRAPLSTFDDRVAPSRLILRYAVTGLVTLIAVSVVTAWVSRRLGTEDAIEDARRVTTIAATAAVEPILTDDLLAMDPDAIARIDRVVRDQVMRGSLVRVKIWSRDGTIVYSDEGRLIGEQFELGEESLEALSLPQGEAESEAEISDLSKPENRFEEPAAKLLEVYLPVYTTTGTPVLFEAYFLYEGVAEAGRRAWLRFAPVTLGSLVFLELLQVPLVLSLAKRLRRTQEQREHLLERSIEAADAERRRIASDLHDGVVQDLAGVTFSLAAAARRLDGTAATEVGQAGDQVRDAIRSLRSLLVEIYPPNLTEEGLEAALSDLMARLDPRGIEATLTIDTAVADLSVDRTQLVYRAVQEALRNVVKHAQATRVGVTVTNGDDDGVVVRVVDDGQGFDPASVPQRDGHLGLRALAGMAATLGGTLFVDAMPGTGTEVRLEVPRS